MCIIMVKEVGKVIKDEWMDNSAKSNEDGFGLSYIHPEKGIKTYKTMNYDNFKREFRRLESRYDNSPFILHFRKTTDGVTDVTNCHPFEVGGLAVFHNGMIKECAPLTKTDERSDTNIFCSEVLANLPNGWYDNETILDLIEFYIGASKLAIMDGEGGVTILNESYGHWYEGVWMSNYSYYPNTRSVQKNKPAAWNSNVARVYNKKKGAGNKTVCYRHPDGNFTKYSNGTRFRWFPAAFRWSPINEDGSLSFVGGVSHYNDSPTTYYYDIVDVKYSIDLRETPRALRLLSHTAKKEEKVRDDEEETKELHMCDWCGDFFLKKELEVYSWSEDNDEDDASILCENCREEICSEQVMVKVNNANLEYYLQHRDYAGVWGNV